MNRITCKKNNGFTLIEILIALSVFAILATITSSALHHALNTRALVTKQADRLSTLQLAMALIQRDTQQIIDRAIRGNDLHVIRAFTGQSHYVEFTRSGGVNPEGVLTHSPFIRVAFLCHQGQLIRRTWSILDTPNRKTYQDKVLIDHLKHCQFAYLSHAHKLLPEWGRNTLTRNQHNESLPTGIQLTLHLNDWGAMSLLMIIPKALYAE